MTENRPYIKGNSYFLKEKLTNNFDEENQNYTINSIELEVENKIVTPIQDIKTPKALTKKISSETIKANMFDTFYDDCIEYKHYVNDEILMI